MPCKERNRTDREFTTRVKMTGDRDSGHIKVADAQGIPGKDEAENPGDPR
jgi:hypothetical protein